MLSLRRFFTVRKTLALLLVLSIIYAGYGIYNKVKYWGFTISPKTLTDIWTVEAKVSFDANGQDTQVSLAVPNDRDGFTILSEDVIAKGYEVTRDKKNNRVVWSGKDKEGRQNLYYRLSIYDGAQNSSRVFLPKDKVRRPILTEEEQGQMRKIWIKFRKLF